MSTPADAGPSADDNPYAAPAAAIDGDRVERPPLRLKGWVMSWTVIYAVNLIVPLLFAMGTVRGVGTFGMVAAVTLMWLFSLWLGTRSSRLRAWLQAGGLAVAVSQVVPMLQIMAGMFAITLAGMIFRRAGRPLEDDEAVRSLGLNGDEFAMIFLTTVLTGAALMVATVAAGFLLVGLGRLLMRSSGRAPSGLS